MLPHLPSLFKYRYLYLSDAPAVFIVFTNESREFDRSSEPSGTAADEDDIHRNRFVVGLIGDNEEVLYEGRLRINGTHDALEDGRAL